MLFPVDCDTREARDRIIATIGLAGIALFLYFSGGTDEDRAVH
jgi:hypothetical protein